MKNRFLLFLLPLFLLAACKKESASPYAELRISAFPEKTHITISGIDCGAAPVGKRVLPGSYLIKAEADGYRTSWKGIKLEAGEKKELQLNLEPVAASILLKTVPNTQAEVVFQGRKYGQTPLILTGLKPGKYSASLKAPGCAPVITEWVIDSPRPQMKTVRVTQNTGTLKIGSAPKNAIVKINGRSCGTVPCSLELEQGSYDVSITAPGYSEFSRRVTLKTGKTVTVEPSLSALPVRLQITTLPAGAEVKVDGESKGTTPFDMSGFSAGKHTITLSLPNYDVVEFEQEAAPGQTLTRSFNLTSGLGSIEFVTIPPGVTVSLDGKLNTVTLPDPDHPGISKVCRISNVTAGPHILIFSHKLAVPSDRREKVIVKKGENCRLKKNVEMWIRNARIFHKHGYSYEGRIVAENEESIRFEKEPGITVLYKKSELKSIQRFKEAE